ncbi:hypothetical protein [Pseudoalteromonas sp. MMG007]|uniref:hypothetical protein n=1 Tax=Pseudoalteromonas sp. MMG007 TaxID=2822684 RepID=UPI001B3618BD|nr:hypothetical protein [Pseudoalteromonas sp. MMG007]MBQ4857118.1 hypothetical protein [Pseudoalteromonas sp. MMG007]
MSKTPNKQSLLGKTPARKKTAQKRKPQPSTQRSQTSNENVQTLNDERKHTKPKKGLFITFAVIAVIILAFPKPTLLTYKKLGMVSESIYWPGVFGKGAMLIDSNLHPQFDSKRKSLYLCSDLQKPQSCQKYQVIADNGVFAVIGSYF